MPIAERVDRAIQRDNNLLPVVLDDERPVLAVAHLAFLDDVVEDVRDVHVIRDVDRRVDRFYAGERWESDFEQDGDGESGGDGHRAGLEGGQGGRRAEYRHRTQRGLLNLELLGREKWRGREGGDSALWGREDARGTSLNRRLLGSVVFDCSL